jgi:hypothetical protein
MRSVPWLLLCALGGMVLLTSCGGSGEEQVAAYAPVIDPAQFTSAVENPFFPLPPGRTFSYEMPDGVERVEMSVMDETREVMGVTCTVVKSREYEEGDLVEETLDWYAQHTDGSVWYFGEDTKAYKGDGSVSTAGSWEAGRDGALPGIIMEGDPKVGDSYREEYWKDHAEDMGEVVQLDGSVSVPYGTFEGVLVTKEWSPLEPGAFEHKYYARGVGLVLEAEGETRVELVQVTEGSSESL